MNVVRATAYELRRMLAQADAACDAAKRDLTDAHEHRWQIFRELETRGALTIDELRSYPAEGLPDAIA